MIANPFARKPKSPVDQVLDVVNNVRADAAGAAGTIRDAASKAADALGDPPVPGGRRLPVIGLIAAAGLGVALALKARAGSGSAPSVTAPPPSPAPSVATAAKSTRVETSTDETPAAEVAPEQPREPKADTPESDAAAS